MRQSITAQGRPLPEMISENSYTTPRHLEMACRTIAVAMPDWYGRGVLGRFFRNHVVMRAWSVNPAQASSRQAESISVRTGFGWSAIDHAGDR